MVPAGPASATDVFAESAGTSGDRKSEDEIKADAEVPSNPDVL